MLSEGDAARSCSYLIGTVEGDLHDIGKNLVSMMLQRDGFKVVDLGTNITAQQFVDAVKEHNPLFSKIEKFFLTVKNYFNILSIQSTIHSPQSTIQHQG